MASSSGNHPQVNPSPASSGGGGGGDRVAHPQWTHHETVELIEIRGKLEREFNGCKRNKVLWESVASRMTDKGFFRTPHQCNSKWKNLLIRYKGAETSDPENGKQCPFFEELHAVFSERAKAMHQSVMNSQPKSAATRLRKITKSNSDQFSYDCSLDEGDQGDDSGEESLLKSSNVQKKRSKKSIDKSYEPINGEDSIEEILKLFLQQQQRLEVQWRESMERHRHERELFEQEWRHSMEKLERERLIMEQEWMEKEEQRKLREEISAEKRDALLTTLLNKLISEDQ